MLTLMFILIREASDYYIYAMLTVLSNGITCTINFFYCKKYCRLKLIKECNLKKHIKNLLIFFANNLAINVYLNADITMLGLLTDDYTVGLYAVSVKIYNVIKAVIAAMFMACIPRLSTYFGNEKKDNYRQLLNDILNICTLLIFPAVAGLIALREPIVLVLAGREYLPATSSLSIICFGIIGAIYGGILTNCVNLPMKRERYNLNGTILAAVINAVLNLFLIPLFHEDGAAITTVIAEFTVMFYCLFSFKKIKQWIMLTTFFKTIVVGVIEGIAVLIFSSILHFTESWVLYIFLLVICSLVFYIVLLSVTKNNYFRKFCSLIKQGK